VRASDALSRFQTHATRTQDSHQHALHVFQHVVIAHSKNAQALLSQERGSTLVVICSTDVAHSVQFHNEHRVVAKEVGNERANGMLATKLQTAQSSAAQPAPQQSFGKRGILP
jgi:hypothetical protein